MLRAILLPASALQLPFNVNLLTLSEILPADIGQLAPCNDVVPFGSLLLLAGLILPGLICGNGETGDCRPGGQPMAFSCRAGGSTAGSVPISFESERLG